MRIIIEALGINAPGGTRSATLNLVKGLLSLEQAGNEYILLVSEEEEALVGANGLRQIVLAPQGPMIDRLRLQVTLPRLARDLKADLVHHTKNLCSFFLPCPYVVTVHDLTILEYPAMFPRTEVLYWRTVQRASLSNAAQVIAVSQNTRADISRHYGLSDAQLSVIYNAYDPFFTPVGESPVAPRLDTAGPYMLHVGSISKKKNLTTLVRAFAKVKKAGRFEGRLVLVGREYYKARDEQLRPMIADLGLADRVVFTGPVSQSDLRDLYRGAAVCVFPSLHEGFGLVPLEAMACGVPLVVSGCAAVKEVVDDAAVIVENARDDGELAEAMITALDDETSRLLGMAGLRRAELFSLSSTATQTAAVYQRVLTSAAN